ncbi:MAG: class IV adenylate cyclase [Candidatus Aenigmarchaeota archaeon]|nr:class IV adenylate cyclase [Candidatus Aenigmarchaeota archaeon]
MDPEKMLEIEVKFRVDDPGTIIERLKRVGARKVDDGFERNIKFDRKCRLLKAGSLLRLRSYAGKADITYKKRLPSEKFMMREEIILNVDSFERGKRLLEAIGFKPDFRYEKRRQTWEYNGAGILVDELVIGNFIEIEGTKEKIEETAGKLGLDMRDAIPMSYGELFIEHCKAKGVPLHDMVFGEGH